jgi:hypothetical protein
VYGRFTREALHKLQLNVRRIRSNIEDRSEFGKRANFVPAAIRFNVAEPELLQLLLQPLYGDDPLYGVRELTQNSSDSVKELKHLLTSGVPIETDQPPLDGDIEIKVLGPPDWSLTRNSDLWKRDFADESGRSKVARTGRFGVGALSAFLIGDRVEVYTRHFTEKTGFGLKFECRIEDDEIEIKRERGPIGTSIKIWSNEKRINSIKDYLARGKSQPFYYVLNDPSITFAVNGEFPATSAVEAAERELERSAWETPAKWVVAASGKYDQVLWDRSVRPDKDWSTRRSGFLYCNGILVGDIRKPSTELVLSRSRRLMNIDPPTVSVTDYNAELPLDLARKGLSTKDDGLSTSVATSIYEEFVADLFASPGTTPSKLIRWWDEKKFRVRFEGWVPFLFGSSGFSVLDMGLIHELIPNRFIVDRASNELLDHEILHSYVRENGWISLFKGYGYGWTSRTDLRRKLREADESNLPNLGPESYTHQRPFFADNYFIMTAAKFESIFELATVPNYVKTMQERAYRFSLGSTPCIIVSRSAMSEDIVKPMSMFVTETLRSRRTDSRLSEPIVVWNNYSGSAPEETGLFKVWQQSFSTKYLPYDLDARRAVLRPDAPIRRYL